MADEEKDEKKPERDDPSDGVVFDENFIRGAKVYEPPWRTRRAIAQYGEPSSSSSRRQRRRSPSGLGPRTWLGSHLPSHLRWYAVVSVVFLVLAVGGIITVIRGTYGSDEPAISGDFKSGHCYKWDQDDASQRRDEVRCSEDHLFEAVKNIPDAFSGDHKFPDEAEQQRVTERLCGPAADAYLGRALDSSAPFLIYALVPTRDGWDGGDREIVCGFVSSRISSADPESDTLRLSYFRGQVKDWRSPSPTSPPSLDDAPEGGVVIEYHDRRSGGTPAALIAF